MRIILFLLFLSFSAQAHPLVDAAERGDLAAVKRMIEAGVYVDVLNAEGETALHEAIDEGHLAIVDYLLKNGANVNFVDHEGEPVLHEAIEEWNIPILERILQEPRLDINAVDQFGRTALMRLAAAGHADWVKRFIHLGASVGDVCNNGKTALQMATDPKVQQVLKDHWARR